jgi:hypothetical protein
LILLSTAKEVWIFGSFHFSQFKFPLSTAGEERVIKRSDGRVSQLVSLNETPKGDKNFCELISHYFTYLHYEQVMAKNH